MNMIDNTVIELGVSRIAIDRSVKSIHFVKNYVTFSKIFSLVLLGHQHLIPLDSLINPFMTEFN